MHTVTVKEKAKHNGTLWGKIKSIFKAPIIPKTHTIEFWDSPSDLPYRRYAKFNKHFMIQMQVGNSVQDYDNRQGRMIGYLNADNKKAAIIELTNQRQCVHNAFEGYIPCGMAGAVLVRSINGVLCEDFHEEALEETLTKLDHIGFTWGMIQDVLSHVKKK